MARKSRHSHRKQASPKQFGVVVGIAVAAALGGGLYLAFHSGSGSKPSAETSAFSISDYRTDASRLTGNRYRIVGRVENIETQGNDRIVAVSIPGNKQERLPLLVRQGSASGVNLTRGDTFVFDTECCTGQDEGQEIKGIMVVRHVETK